MVMRLVPVLAAAAACFAASATVAQSLKSDSILSSIAVRPVSEPILFLAQMGVRRWRPTPANRFGADGNLQTL